MTSQQQADLALDLYQDNKCKPREVMETLLDQFFATFPSLSEYEARQQAVTREMECRT